MFRPKLASHFNASDSKLDSSECDYNQHHYNMLLCEIVRKGDEDRRAGRIVTWLQRVDMAYYLDWIIAKVTDQNTSRQVRDIIGHAASSLLDDKPVVHTCRHFTAYRAFFLLAKSRTRDVESVLKTIRAEDGLRAEGLEQAILLLGAFDGRSRSQIDEILQAL